MDHIAKLIKTAEKQGTEANFAVFNPTNITYFTNFNSATALLITPQGQSILYVSGVNYEQAKEEAQNAQVQLLKRGENVLEKIANQSTGKKLAIDIVSIEGWRALAKIAGEQNLLCLGNLFRELRAVKDQEEIELIKQACEIACVGMETAEEVIRPNVEEKMVAAEVEYAMRKAGSDGIAFETIVASGSYSAFCHGCNREKTIREGDFVTVDLGATCKFYRSDLTRTFLAGKASEKQRKMYETVLLANQKAFETIKPRVAAKDVDAVARQIIDTAGFGEFFVHNLGHGVGLEVHEAPVLGPNSEDILAANNVVTDEPGIYVPGFGGIRIEDTVLVTKEGAEKLTPSPYKLEIV